MMDVLPTLAGLAGAKLPTDRKLDGVDVWPVIAGQTNGPRQVFHYFRGLELEAIRQGEWKLHLAKKELYDLGSDIAESKNLYESKPELVKQLTELAQSMDSDLGVKGIGPACRPLGRSATSEPWIK